MTRTRSDKYSQSARRKHAHKGVPVVAGIAMGKVHIKFRRTQVLSDSTITEDQLQREIEILNEAVRRSKEQMLIARAKVAKDIGELEATIFDAHIAILEDRAFLGKVRGEVERDMRPAEVVIAVIVEGHYQAMRLVRDEHMRERAADIRDVGNRLLENVMALKNEQQQIDQEVDRLVPEGDIIFARELLPSDIATIERRHVAAVVTEAGSNRGHCAIMLKAINIPAVMGVEGIASIIKDGDYVIVDGGAGLVLVNPRKEVIKSYQESQHEYARYLSMLDREVDKAPVTPDGHEVRLYANVNKASDVSLAHLHRMDGIGLFRTEFMLMARDSSPDEDDQYQMYREVIEQADGKPVTVRTMDLGADKRLPYMRGVTEANHALGRRSIRLAFGELEDFQVLQLRAILRASVHGKIRLLFPFITSVEDMRLARRLLRMARHQLDERKVRCDPDLPIGMMVEVPSAALSLEKFVREVQFFSVGTNDLVQYVCAADRNQADVSAWYKACNPGVLFLLKHLVQTAREHSRPLAVCGEMAGDPFYTMFLLGIGVTEFSMAAPQLPLVKKVIRSVPLSGAQRLVDRALQLTSTNQIRELFQGSVENIIGRDVANWSQQQ